VHARRTVPPMLALVFLATLVAQAAPEPTPTLSPRQLLGQIRAVFRSHRPPPEFESYTLTRKQNATNGYPDPVDSYTKHIWIRNSDRAALTRLVFRDFARGDLAFDRPAFNEARDPGPPTADVFEPAPAVPHPVSQAYTPEPSATALPVIGTIRAVFELDYEIRTVAVEGNELHITVYPLRDIERNRLREIFVDRKTLELHRLIATDKLFELGGSNKVYPVTFTVTMGNVAGYPVVTRIHGEVGGGYNEDGQLVDFTFTDIKFPPTLPAWYFDPKTYAAHGGDAPL
jgi:hypothetical protein